MADTLNFDKMSIAEMQKKVTELNKTINDFLSSNDPERDIKSYRIAKKQKAQLLTYISNQSEEANHG